MTMSEKTPQSARLTELDALRGLAAMAVVLCHYTNCCREIGSLSSSFSYGSYGAHLFFIISGFVIFMTIGRCKSGFDFVYSRCSRLFPVYWLAVLFSTLVILIFQIRDHQVTVIDLLGNLTMCQTWLRIPDIEVSYWTLGIEIKFYALMLGYLLVGKRFGIERLCCVWLLLIVAFRLGDRLVGLPHVLSTPLILDLAHLFVAGIMFYQLKQVGHSAIRHGLIAAAVPMQFLAGGTESALVIAGLMGVFYLVISGRLKSIAAGPLVFLGDISYPLYLIHGVTGYAIIYGLATLTGSPWILIPVPIFVSCVIAYLFSIYVERPSLHMLRSWRKRSLGAGIQPNIQNVPG
jgi:peptidoglycan/LPS O-acetylase OafA/YrhL